ncbi:MAG TPA: endonuclease/exonuclease/phosphatase family protein [Candidatus Acidoferrales bacterium]|nr:endonuclease/exonuclease/phosphatase family protein [Candidatus Acidoferrales bacterium]
MPTENELTIATYNILFGINREQIIENIEQMAKDGVTVFCLQEVINVTDKAFILDAILQRLGKHWQAAYHVGPEIGKLSIGTAILWNTTVLNLKSEDKIELPKIKKFDLHERLYYQVIGVSGVPLQRKAICCDFTFNKTPIRITCVHLDNVGGPRHRYKQFSYLVSSLIAKPKIDHEIIAGDFNTFDLLRTGYEKKLLQRNLGDEFIDASKQVGWTSDIYNIDFTTSIRLFKWLIKNFNIHVRRRLDYIWVKNFVVKTCYKLSIPGSDHFPVIAKLRISKSPPKQ